MNERKSRAILFLTLRSRVRLPLLTTSFNDRSNDDRESLLQLLKVLQERLNWRLRVTVREAAIRLGAAAEGAYAQNLVSNFAIVRQPGRGPGPQLAIEEPVVHTS